ncbi:TPR repeat-containing protein [Blastochloris viridis]|nr:TPR repeat-containing protein [Blastochloris viridis]
MAAHVAAAATPELAAATVGTVATLWPDNPNLFVSLGLAAIYQEHARDAVAVFRSALQRMPQAPQLYAGLGLALMKNGELDEAIATYGTAATLAPARAVEWLAEANHEMALVLRSRGQFQAAAAAIEQALALRPDWPDAHCNLGLVYRADERLDEAIRCYRRAIELDPCHVIAHSNLGSALREAGRPEEAMAVLHRAIELAPDGMEGYGNLANVMQGLGRIDDARALLDRAISCRPDHPKHALARFNRALLIMLDGDLARGFAEYEWRRNGGQPAFVKRSFATQEWQGEALAGRTILLYAEQGLGDTIQFCRYVPMVEALGARIVLQVHAGLVSLVAAAFPAAVVVANGEPLPPFDCHFPLMSLAWRFGTTLDTVPAEVPYLAVDPAKRAAWQARLSGADGLKVGLVWAGNAKTKHDRQRSLAAAALLPHLPRAGVSLFSLQKDCRPGDEAALAAFGGPVTDLAPLLGDFSDTAAAVSALDLVISVDSAVAHLAGALARPTWVLLPYALDWRWLRERADSPWYPTVRLFRQHAAGDWSDVLAKAGAALHAAARQGAVPPFVRYAPPDAPAGMEVASAA